MLVRIRDLINIADDKTYDVDIKYINVEKYPYLKRIENTKGYISFYYDLLDKLRIEYSINGKMICPDSYTLEDVEVDFELNSDEEVCFKEDEEGFFIYGDMEIEQLVLNIVLPEAPIKVEKCKETMYDNEGNWSLMSEEEYDKAKKNRLDPRLAKLMDYKEEK